MTKVETINYDEILLQARRLRAETMRELMAAFAARLFGRGRALKSKEV